jgi:hypothetical protein
MPFAFAYVRREIIFRKGLMTDEDGVFVHNEDFRSRINILNERDSPIVLRTFS